MESFLWMDPPAPEKPQLVGIEHLDMKALHKLMFGNLKATAMTAEQLPSLFSTNPDVIKGRQAVILDLLKNPDLADLFYDLCNKLTDWQEYLQARYEKPHDVYENLVTYSRMETVLHTVLNLRNALDSEINNGKVTADWLGRIRTGLIELCQDLNIEVMMTKWKDAMVDPDVMKSLDVGLNMNELHEIVSAKLLTTHDYAYIKADVIKDDEDKREHIVPRSSYKLLSPDSLLNRILKTGVQSREVNELVHDNYGQIYYKMNDSITYSGRNYDNPYVEEDILNQTGQDNAEEFKALLTSLDTLFMICTADAPVSVKSFLGKLLMTMNQLRDGVAFFVGGVEIAKYLQKHGCSYCFPQMGNGREMVSKGLYNPFLIDAKRKSDLIVNNEVSLSETGEIAVITGANQGGKTTYLTSVALAQFMFQIGLPIAAEDAVISMVDSMLLVYASAEQHVNSTGRLEQELMELSSAFNNLHSNRVFFAFNEPVTGTSSTDGTKIMRDMLCALKIIGAHGVLVTHLHKLAGDIGSMNKQFGGSKLKSMIAKVEINEDGATPLYKIIEGEPENTSYAYDVLKRSRIY